MGKGKGRKVTYWNERESPHYLTIHQPYPMNASMDIEADRMAFSYWIASCIGRENLLAFFHKPKVCGLHHHLTQCAIFEATHAPRRAVSPRREMGVKMSWVRPRDIRGHGGVATMSGVRPDRRR